MAAHIGLLECSWGDLYPCWGVVLCAYCLGSLLCPFYLMLSRTLLRLSMGWDCAEGHWLLGQFPGLLWQAQLAQLALWLWEGNALTDPPVTAAVWSAGSHSLRQAAV